jgi:hypothetical protein
MAVTQRNLSMKWDISLTMRVHTNFHLNPRSEGIRTDADWLFQFFRNRDFAILFVSLNWTFHPLLKKFHNKMSVDGEKCKICPIVPIKWYGPRWSRGHLKEIQRLQLLITSRARYVHDGFLSPSTQGPTGLITSPSCDSAASLIEIPLLRIQRSVYPYLSDF